MRIPCHVVILQILCGGENVYSSEVEAVLFAHPAVSQAAVFGVPNAVMGELVAAAVVLKPEAAAVGERVLVAWCRERLAHYKVPSQVRCICYVSRAECTMLGHCDVHAFIRQLGATLSKQHRAEAWLQMDS